MRKPLPGSSIGSTCIAAQDFRLSVSTTSCCLVNVTLEYEKLTSTKSGRLFHQV